ncbi:MAG: formate dehydrogenase subunit gamma [Burkholderiales bacterium]|nr:formate dehydrogenase subunit gamma [Burkholderiales bacterium]
MHHFLRQGTAVLVATVALALVGGAAAQQAAAPAPSPAASAGPALPQPDETNAERARSQPGNNAPFWRDVRESGNQPGYTSLPGPETGQLIQGFVQYPGSRVTTAGEAWRQVRNDWIIPYGGSLMLVALVALALVYVGKGPLGGHVPDTGRKIERFSPFERAAHWLNAAAFVVLAVSGIVMAFGKFLLLPVLGSSMFGWLAYMLKTMHNFVGPLFAVTLLVVILTFARDNLPRDGDWQWLVRFGGMFGGQEVPSHRFNAGEKLIFWLGVLALGVLVAVSGIVLNQIAPGIANTRAQMQVAHMLHAAAAMLMMAMFLGHIYMGTIGMRGAYAAMRHGWVDEGWAKEHHALWYDDVKTHHVPAKRSSDATPAAQPRTT